MKLQYLIILLIITITSYSKETGIGYTKILNHSKFDLSTTYTVEVDYTGKGTNLTAESFTYTVGEELAEIPFTNSDIILLALSKDKIYALTEAERLTMLNTLASKNEISLRNKTGKIKFGFMLEGSTVKVYNIESTETPEAKYISHTKGERQYELSNHLGNVLASVSDVKLSSTEDVSQTKITSSFEGDDGQEFRAENGTYVQRGLFSTTESRTGTGCAEMTHPSTQYGPTRDVIVKPGDIVNASIYGRADQFQSNGNSGLLVVDFVNLRTGERVKDIDGNHFWFGNSISESGGTDWQKLEITVTLPDALFTANSNEDVSTEDIRVAIFPWVPNEECGTNFFDDLEINITRNNTESEMLATVTSAQFYYPFGMILPDPNNDDEGGSYRYEWDGKGWRRVDRE